MVSYLKPLLRWVEQTETHRTCPGAHSWWKSALWTSSSLWMKFRINLVTFPVPFMLQNVLIQQLMCSGGWDIQPSFPQRSYSCGVGFQLSFLQVTCLWWWRRTWLDSPPLPHPANPDWFLNPSQPCGGGGEERTAMLCCRLALVPCFWQVFGCSWVSSLVP